MVTVHVLLNHSTSTDFDIIIHTVNLKVRIVSQSFSSHISVADHLLQRIVNSQLGRMTTTVPGYSPTSARIGVLVILQQIEN